MKKNLLNGLLITAISIFTPVLTQAAPKDTKMPKKLKKFVNFSNNLSKIYLMSSLLDQVNMNFHEKFQSMPKILAVYNQIKPKMVHWHLVDSKKQQSKIKLFNANLANADNKPLNFCLTNYKNNIYPGRLTTKGCLITYAGETKLKEKYAVLVGHAAVQWFPLNLGPRNIPITILKHAAFSLRNYARNPHYPTPPIRSLSNKQIIHRFIAGYEHDNNKPIYLCRIIYKNKLYIGKYSKNYCHAAINGKEKDWRYGELLYVTAVKPH